MLWELFARRAPFEGLHPHTLIYLVVSRHLRPDISDSETQDLSATDGSLLELMKECWSSEVARRPAAFSIVNKLRSTLSSQNVGNDSCIAENV
ncbi:unnamed protein product [Anisakis simplex]|uniref:Serine-threonine/tyrosine-protein kinase catalytic domain-containing protein n=1 Tax=Anisakis simplex TaxID=6269 RepID=A0A3P6RWS8_ANISI|nr:unnamed protein product [Anisakis simplex]